MASEFEAAFLAIHLKNGDVVGSLIAATEVFSNERRDRSSRVMAKEPVS
jgi:hypothetical protein